MSDSDDRAMKTLLKTALETAQNKEAAKNTLALLFPKMERIARTYAGIQSNDSERRRNRRLSISDFSKNYFNLTPQSGSWGKSEFEIAIKSDPADAFEALQRRLAFATLDEQSDLRRIFLELLDAEFSSRKDLSKEWLLEFIKQSQTLIASKDEETKFLFSVDNADRLRWLILHGLERLSKDHAVDCLKSAIALADDITILCDLIRTILGDVRKEGSQTERSKLNLGDDALEIRSTLLDRVRKIAESNAMWDQIDPSVILWFWWGATTDDQVKEFTKHQMKSPLGLRKLLQVSVSRVRSTEKDYDRVSPTWEKLVDLRALSESAVQLTQTGNDLDKEIAERFLDALKAGQERHF